MKRFSIVENGYDIDEVNRFIDIVIERLERLNAENASYIAKIDKLTTKIKESNDTVKLEKALLVVQDASDKIKEVAKEEAKIIVEEAKNNANSIIHEALVNAEKTEQERIMLEKNIKMYKERVKSLIEGQLSLLDDINGLDME